MTKRRPALTIELALETVGVRIGWDEVARLAGFEQRTVRNWSDPDTTPRPEDVISLALSMKLDVAYRQAGGEGAPMLQSYALRLDTETAAACADVRERAKRIAKAAKETGEALEAQILANLPGASPAAQELAKRETEQAIGALTNTLPNLGAGPGSTVSVPGEGK